MTGGTGTTAYIKPYANMTAGSVSFTGPVQLQNSIAMDTLATDGNLSFSTTLDAAGCRQPRPDHNRGHGQRELHRGGGRHKKYGGPIGDGRYGHDRLYKTLREHDGGASISFTGPVQLQNGIAMDTSAANGNLSFSTTLDALAAGTQGLTISSGSGTVTFTGAVGSTAALASLSVTSLNAAPNAILLSSSVLTTGAQSYIGLTTVAGAAASVVNASTGLLSFTAVVTHSSGTIQAGAVASGPAIKFGANYAASGTAALVGNAAASGIEFDANATLASFTHSGDTLLFKGAVAQQFDSTNQIIGNVVIDDAVGVVIAGHSVHQTGGSFTTTIDSGYLDVFTNGATLGWVADSAAGTAATAGLFNGIAGTLSFGNGTGTTARELRCIALTTGAAYSIINTNPNTVTASGSVNIGGGFTPVNSINSTLVMTGAPTNLAATPQIGNLIVSGSVTLGSAISLAGKVDISATTASLDVSPCELSNHPRRQLGRQRQNRRRAQLRGRDRKIHGEQHPSRREQYLVRLRL